MVAIEHGDAAGARSAAQQMMAHAATGPRAVSLMRAHLLAALAECIGQCEEAALQSADEALRLGYPEGVIRPFLDFGLVGRASMERLLTHASQRAESEGHRAFASQVLQAMRADTVVIDTLTLTARESLILEELSKGATNKVIARRLSLSERTVKLLLANLFTKLNVTHRRAAAMEARRRGLLPEAMH
jgi:DNA-binding CsgD family transcriptional regulator